MRGLNQKRSGIFALGLVMTTFGCAPETANTANEDCVALMNVDGREYRGTTAAQELPLRASVGEGTLPLCDENTETTFTKTLHLMRIAGISPTMAVGVEGTDESPDQIWVSIDEVPSLDEPPAELDPYID